jgi:MFS family permease
LRTLKLSLLDAFLYSLMVGVGETYLPAYVLSIGMNEVFAGILASLPLVSGAFLQLFTPKGLQKIGSHKSWVVGTTFVQALTFLPLIYFSDHGSPNFWSLFLILTLYWAASFASGPAWNYWMGQIVPSDLACRYFAKRARVSQYALLIGVVGGGMALHFKVELGPFSSVFGFIFFLGFAARLGSSILLSAHHFQKDWTAAESLIGVRDSLKLFLNTGIKRKFFLYFLPLQVAVYLSSPFVTPYLLAQLKLDYISFMGALAAMLIGKILILMLLQYRHHTLDPFRMFGVGLIMISAAPLLWSLYESYIYIICLQLMSGMAWACFEVGLSLIFFRDLKQDEKVPILTVYNVLSAVGIIIGTAIGGQLIVMLGTNKTAYLIVFTMGGALRLLFGLALVRVVRVWRKEFPASDSVENAA